LLNDSNRDLELLVIDQSDGDDSEQALLPFRADTRLRYVRSETRGKGAALNQGFELARGAIVVCTDDDCDAPQGWVTRMAQTLDARPDAAIVFCQVVPVPHDSEQGYVPAYALSADRLLRSIEQGRSGFGLGAGMAVRRDFLLEVGGFDECFGPGARFPSADEWDLSIRALLKGRQIFETAELAILHDGFRSFQDGRVHARRDWLALGAVCAKPIRAGHLRAAVVPLWFFPTKALWPPLKDLLHLRKPRGAVRVVAFLEGFSAGLRLRVDPKTLRFIP
jgi:GT2 family glycosyltransferase